MLILPSGVVMFHMFYAPFFEGDGQKLIRKTREKTKLRSVRIVHSI